MVDFEYYLQWLSTNDRSFLGDLGLYSLAKLYILGGFLDDTAFRVEMLNIFVKEAIDKYIYPGARIVALAWGQTPEGSPLRKIILEIWITSSIKLLAKRFGGIDEDVPKAFIVDCLHRIGDTRARANETMTTEDRKKTLESRRDEVLQDLV